MERHHLRVYPLYGAIDMRNSTVEDVAYSLKRDLVVGWCCWIHFSN